MTATTVSRPRRTPGRCTLHQAHPAVPAVPRGALGPGPRHRCRLRRWYIPRQPAAEDAAIEGARRNIQRHYDLSDDLFAAFLDPQHDLSPRGGHPS
jgi:Mycolic acid cyclopropane synthetase